MKRIFTHIVLPILMILTACTNTATPTATQLPSATSTQTSVPTNTLTITPTDTPTPPPTQTPMVEERFQPDEFFFTVLKDENGITVQTNDPVLETVDSTTAKTHLFVDHVAQSREDACVGPTNKTIIINQCFIHHLPADVTGFKAKEGEVRDYKGTAIFYNRATVNDPWAVYFLPLAPTETLTPVPSPTLRVTPTATLAPLTTLASVLANINAQILPDTRFCSDQLDQFGEVIVNKVSGKVYLISPSPCPTVYVAEKGQFVRIQPLGFVKNPVELKGGYKFPYAWVTEVPYGVDSYGIGWTKGHIVGLGLRIIGDEDTDGHKIYFEITPATATPTVTTPVTPTLTPTLTLPVTPSKTPTPGS